ncbi:cytochrome c3 family protein [Carboxylicivirga marina]|uniref:cytochrome c3 family protein n=1 Tax=Carboxylicivirga marina TaxID=2800988 RepID=UPI00259A82EC|nr:cytochrome c3 family protein [uncultured Carboxylicivirga sp.]
MRMLFFVLLTLLSNHINSQSTKDKCINCHGELSAKPIIHGAIDDNACDNCHESTGQNHPQTDVAGFKLMDKVPDLCFYCHEENNTHNNVHYPVQEGECNACHDVHSANHASLLIDNPVGNVCAMCHDLEISNKSVQHYPAAEGECSACHDPHSSDESYFLKQTPSKLCFECHDADMMNKSNQHYPAAEGECSTCHNPHASNESYLLQQSPTTLCAECHDLEMTDKSSQHYPAAEGECSMCHDPHAADQPFFLKQEKKNLCFECHDDIKQQNDLAVIHYPFDDDCGNCHQPHASEHAALLTENVPALCLNCHDFNSKSHRHYPAAEGECLTCHSPHASAHSSLLLEPKASNLCLTCHDQEIPESDMVHYPVKEGQCSSCHDPHESDHPFFIKKEKKQLCFTCHEDIKIQSETAYQHYPFEDDCANCHGTHHAPNNKLLIEENKALCYTCHDEMYSRVENDKHVHWPVINKEGCVACHSPHASDQPYFLIKDNKEVCLNCHNRTIKTDHNKVENIARKLKKSKTVHAALEMDGCVTCHDPHTAQTGQFVKDVFPESEYTPAVADSFALCFSCHDAALIENKITSEATEFREGQVNLHYLHINDNKGRSCAICHDVHASNNEHLIADDFVFGQQVMAMRYQHDADGGSCYPGCHAKKDYDRERKKLPENSTSELLALLHEQSKGGSMLNVDQNRLTVSSSVASDKQSLAMHNSSSKEGENLAIRERGSEGHNNGSSGQGGISEQVASELPVNNNTYNSHSGARIVAMDNQAVPKNLAMVNGDNDEINSSLTKNEQIDFLEYYNLIFTYSKPSAFNAEEDRLDELAVKLLNGSVLQSNPYAAKSKSSGVIVDTDGKVTSMVYANTMYLITQIAIQNMDEKEQEQLYEMIMTKPELMKQLTKEFEAVKRAEFNGSSSLEYYRITHTYLQKYNIEQGRAG